MKEDVRELPCKLTDDERQLIQAEHVRTCDVLAEAEDKKKRTVKELSAGIEDIKTEERKQRRAAISGYQDRPVKCVEHIDADMRTAQWYRSDTGETVGPVRAASPAEIKTALHELYLKQQGTLFQGDTAAPEGATITNAVHIPPPKPTDDPSA